MGLHVLAGDLLEQPVEVIVNPWNRNIIPWWLLLPQGVSGAIKRRAGLRPFWELGRVGPIRLGGAVLTTAGRLPFRGIVHVAGIDMFWRASEFSIRESARNALQVATEHGFASVAFPLIGAGSGGASAERSEQWMCEELSRAGAPASILLVRYRPQEKRPAFRR